MSSTLELLKGLPTRHVSAGDLLLETGTKTGVLLVLIEGAIEVRKSDVQVDFVREPGAVFGEISALLDAGHSADVFAAEDSTLYVIDNPRAFLREQPEFLLHVAELLAQRLRQLTTYLIDVKRQYEGHDHIGMVDHVLDSLVHRQPRKRGP